jgi:hypothetical protein
MFVLLKISPFLAIWSGNGREFLFKHQQIITVFVSRHGHYCPGKVLFQPLNRLLLFNQSIHLRLR